MTPNLDPTDTPLLLICWRRPETLRMVINAIRPVAPKQLFVACDGPNSARPGESEKVAATRWVIQNEIDWPCQIKTLYSDYNQGCRLGVSRAISWFFKHVEEGIILEDDCVPHPDFFLFCTALLKHYRNDTRVWCVSGSNCQHGQWRGDGSYYFSRYSHVWGWASWRRCWQHYDSELRNLPTFINSGYHNNLFEDFVERIYFKRCWQRLVDHGQPDTWAHRWIFTCIVNGGLTVIPNRNLVCNVGFGPDATHATGRPIDTSISEGVDPSQHPSFLLRDAGADRFTFNTAFGGKWLRFPWSLIRLPNRVGSAVARNLKTVYANLW